MKSLINFFREEDGLGTVEIVVIIAVLIGVALIFRTQIFHFVETTMSKIFKQSEEVTDIHNNSGAATSGSNGN